MRVCWILRKALRRHSNDGVGTKSDRNSNAEVLVPPSLSRRDVPERPKMEIAVTWAGGVRRVPYTCHGDAEAGGIGDEVPK